MALTPEQALKTVDKLYMRLARRRPEIEELDRYYRGLHPLRYATDEWAKLHAKRYRDFSDNWCGVVGSAPGERTELQGFRLGDDTDIISDDEKVLWRDWEVNEGPAQSSQGFLMSTVAKRSSVLVWGDENDEPVMTWERPDQVIVDYDPANPRRRRAALKAWIDRDENAEYATLYTDDAVWKYQRTMSLPRVTETGLHVASNVVGLTAGWTPRQDPEDDSWPLENPMGRVPVVEFPNRPVLGGEPLSDIAGTVAMQNAINLLWAYLFVAADFASMPARVVLGQSPPKIPKLDENGQVVGEIPVDEEKLKNGRMLWLTGEQTKIDSWQAASLNVFTDVIQIGAKHISAQTRTPIYLIHGELGNVNGETLIGLDEPLNSKVRESHKFYQSPVREVFSLMALARGDTRLADACRTGDVQWKNPAVRSDAQVSDAALKDRQVGMPLAAVLENRYGYSPERIKRILAQVEAENSDPFLAQADAKVVPGGDPGTDAEPAPVGA